MRAATGEADETFAGVLMGKVLSLSPNYTARLNRALARSQLLPSALSTFAPIAGEFLTGFNAVTGMFTAAAVSASLTVHHDQLVGPLTSWTLTHTPTSGGLMIVSGREVGFGLIPLWLGGVDKGSYTISGTTVTTVYSWAGLDVIYT
jgi:hypothetical protein